MSQWVEIELRKEQFDRIINSLENCACKSNDYYEIESYVNLINDLFEQEDKYNEKLLKSSDFNF